MPIQMIDSKMATPIAAPAIQKILSLDLALTRMPPAIMSPGTI
jgi:hypothetical protein